MTVAPQICIVLTVRNVAVPALSSVVNVVRRSDTWKARPRYDPAKSRLTLAPIDLLRLLETPCCFIPVIDTNVFCHISSFWLFISLHPQASLFAIRSTKVVTRLRYRPRWSECTEHMNTAHMFFGTVLLHASFAKSTQQHTSRLLCLQFPMTEIYCIQRTCRSIAVCRCGSSILGTPQLCLLQHVINVIEVLLALLSRPLGSLLSRGI
jgi:hypothetical protein